MAIGLRTPCAHVHTCYTPPVVLLRSLRAPLTALALGALAACGELKMATPVDNDDGPDASPRGLGDGSSGDGATGSHDAPGLDGELPDDPSRKPPALGFGPGPYGALPSGYCCNDDDECRSRRCEDLGGGKMCRDSCSSNGPCRRPPKLVWTCDNDNALSDGFCKPDGAFTCIPAAEFELGTRATGEYCTATADGSAGLECIGGRCVASGDGPFICAHRCVQPKDCPSGLVCIFSTDNFKDCVPATSSFTRK